MKLKLITLTALALAANLTFASCLQRVNACGNTEQVPVEQCSNYYVEKSNTEDKTTTYCTDHSLCLAGVNNCIKGTKGCHKYHIPNRHYTHSGMRCGFNGNYCSQSTTKYSCTTKHP